jgi:cyanophycin synthetase
MRLDIEDWRRSPTDKIPGFYGTHEGVAAHHVFHRCSEDHEGGFFERVTAARGWGT